MSHPHDDCIVYRPTLCLGQNKRQECHQSFYSHGRGINCDNVFTGRTPQLFTVYIKEVVVNDRQVLVTDTPRLAPVLAVAVVSGSAVAGSIYQTRPALGEIIAGCDRPGQKAMRQQPTAADS